MHPTIGVLGSYGGLNIGDEAILTCIVERLRSARPGAELVVFSRRPEHTVERHLADRVVPWRGVSRESVLPDIERLDLLVLGGGGILYDGEARHYMRAVISAQQRGIHTFGYAIGAGPLAGMDDAALVREGLEGMTAFTVRDQETKLVLEDIGLTRPIEVTADPAMLLTAEEFTPTMLMQEGVPEHNHLVGMSVREPGRAATNLDANGYHALLAEAADFVVHRLDAHILFVPMERDDIRRSHAVLSHMVAPDRARVLNGDYGPGQILGLMRHLDFVVGMRLHVLIFAAVSGVPFLPLPYAGKVFDFARTVGAPALTGVTREAAGPLLATVDRIWDLRRHQAAHIRQRVAEQKRRAARAGDAAEELLDRLDPRPATRG
ncbi:MAG TPA: polysaccharide pyruvyl transferase family protein [Mycobacteriales bacterium]